ncbi:unnamed protein product [Lota lota]
MLLRPAAYRFACLAHKTNFHVKVFEGSRCPARALLNAPRPRKSRRYFLCCPRLCLFLPPALPPDPPLAYDKAAPCDGVVAGQGKHGTGLQRAGSPEPRHLKHGDFQGSVMSPDLGWEPGFVVPSGGIISRKG